MTTNIAVAIIYAMESGAVQSGGYARTLHRNSLLSLSARDGGRFLRNVGTCLRIQDVVTRPKRQFSHTDRRRDVKCHDTAVV
jgi:hypothetical protein